MTSVSASDFDAVMNLAGQVSDTNIEKIIDLAIGGLNGFGADLPSMSGTAGSKTVGLESKEYFWVFYVARAIYYSYYKDIEPAAVQGLSLGTADLMSNATVLAAIKEGARQLVELEVSHG